VRLRFVASALVLSACGLDLVGTATDTPGGGTGPTSEAGAPVGEGGVRLPDGGFVSGGGIDASFDAGPPPILTGARETVATQVNGLHALVLNGDTLSYGFQGGIQTLNANLSKGPADNGISNVRSLQFGEGHICFATSSGIGISGGAGFSGFYANDVACANGRFAGTTHGNDVETWKYDLSNTIQLAVDTNGTTTSLAIDTTNVFWADSKRGIVYKAPLTAQGAPLYSDAPGVNSIVLDGTDILFATSSAILRGPKAGGTPTTLVSGLANPLSLAIDDKYVYWQETTKASVKRMSKTGGPIATIYDEGTTFTDLSFMHIIAVSATYVYWGAPSDSVIYRIAK
jgi:hypothetical protein